MAKDIANEEIRDTENHTYTIPNSGDTPVTFVYSNGLDTAITIVVEGTYNGDEDYSESITLEGGKSIATSETGYDTMGYPWDKVRFTVTADTQPSSGTLTIKKMEGD